VGVGWVRMLGWELGGSGSGCLGGMLGGSWVGQDAWVGCLGGSKSGCLVGMLGWELGGSECLGGCFLASSLIYQGPRRQVTGRCKKIKSEDKIGKEEWKLRVHVKSEVA